jgi:hypothetical protein
MYRMFKSLKQLKKEGTTKEYVPVDYRRRYYVPISSAINNAFLSLVDLYQGQVINIVGSGASLEYLRAEHLAGHMTICLNNSVHQVNTVADGPLFAIQIDASLRDRAYCCRATMLLSPRAWTCYTGYTNLIMIQEPLLGVYGPSMPCICVAVALCRFLQSKNIRFLCCDYHAKREKAYHSSIYGEHILRSVYSGLENQIVPFNKVIKGQKHEYITPESVVDG